MDRRCCHGRKGKKETDGQGTTVGSFFEEYDVSGKTIVPFCTDQGSCVDSGYELLKDECDGATVAEGFNGNNTDLNEVTNWLKSQGYIND